MDYQNFLQCIRIGVVGRVTEKKVELHKIIKNNDVQLDGLIIRKKGSFISPTIYLNDYYQDYMNGRSLEDIVDEIMEIYEQHMDDRIVDEQFFSDFSRIKKRIVYKIINRKENQNLLKTVPYIPFLDFAVVFYYLFDPSSEVCGTVLIHQQHIHAWNVELDTIYRYAKRNTPLLLPPVMLHMDDIMREYLENRFRRDIEENGRLRETMDNDHVLDAIIDRIVEKIPMEAGKNMFVLSNEKRYLGAAVIMYNRLLKKIADRLEMDLIILPSSIHEVILVPDNGCYSYEKLSDFVKSVNEREVREDERLSDHVYVYNRKKDSITY